MAKETIAERLARLKAESQYDLAPELRYQPDEEVPVPESELVPEVEVEQPRVEALRLEEPNPEQEYEWLVNCRDRGIVPAIRVFEKERYRLDVYPKGGRRFTLAARQEFRVERVRANGLVATRWTRDEGEAERLLFFMIEVAEKDATPERLQKALSITPQEWVHELVGYGGEWLSPTSGNLPEGPVGDAWKKQWGRPNIALSSNDPEVYLAYLQSERSPVIAPQTRVSERLRAYRRWAGELYKSYCQRNQCCASLGGPRLEDYIAEKAWTGWDDFSASHPEAPGVLELSAVGYSDDREQAYFTVVNRCDPRLLSTTNEKAATLEYLERVWLERRPNGWSVRKKVRRRAEAVNVGLGGALATGISIIPKIAVSPDRLEDLRVDVECHSVDEMMVGFENDRPVAFFTLASQSYGVGVVYLIRDEEPRRYEPPEVRTVEELSFQLQWEDFSAVRDGAIIRERFPHDSINVSVYVWIDGDWRNSHIMWEPWDHSETQELSDQVCFVEHDPLTLDWLYRSRHNARRIVPSDERTFGSLTSPEAERSVGVGGAVYPQPSASEPQAWLAPTSRTSGLHSEARSVGDSQPSQPGGGHGQWELGQCLARWGETRLRGNVPG